MYITTVDSSPQITVSNGKLEVQYAINGSFMNPLEAFYAALTGCAAVFTKKACKTLGIVPDGIEINCKPFAGLGASYTLNKFKTEVKFPAQITAEQKVTILDSIQHCLVKEIVKAGPNIEFILEEV